MFENIRGKGARKDPFEADASASSRQRSEPNGTPQKRRRQPPTVQEMKSDELLIRSVKILTLGIYRQQSPPLTKSELEEAELREANEKEAAKKKPPPEPETPPVRQKEPSTTYDTFGTFPHLFYPLRQPAYPPAPRYIPPTVISPQQNNVSPSPPQSQLSNQPLGQYDDSKVQDVSSYADLFPEEDLDPVNLENVEPKEAINDRSKVGGMPDLEFVDPDWKPGQRPNPVSSNHTQVIEINRRHVRISGSLIVKPRNRTTKNLP